MWGVFRRQLRQQRCLRGIAPRDLSLKQSTKPHQDYPVKQRFDLPRHMPFLHSRNKSPFRKCRDIPAAVSLPPWTLRRAGANRVDPPLRSNLQNQSCICRSWGAAVLISIDICVGSSVVSHKSMSISSDPFNLHHGKVNVGIQTLFRFYMWYSVGCPSLFFCSASSH